MVEKEGEDAEHGEDNETARDDLVRQAGRVEGHVLLTGARHHAPVDVLQFGVDQVEARVVAAVAASTHDATVPALNATGARPVVVVGKGQAGQQAAPPDKMRIKNIRRASVREKEQGCFIRQEVKNICSKRFLTRNFFF